MTEAAYQACRKLMQKANYLRGMITNAKGKVAQWTAIEDSHRRNLREGQANGAKNMIEKALVNLEKWKVRFSELKFPDPDMKEEAVVHTCKTCGLPVSKYDEFCGECETSVLSKQEKIKMEKVQQKNMANGTSNRFS